MTILILIHSPFRMWTIPASHVERLRRGFPAHTFHHAIDDAEGLRIIAGVEVAFSSQIGPGLLRAASRLRWIHSPAAGVGGMLYPDMIGSPVVLTNSRGLAADSIAEHVLAVILALFRRLPLAMRRQAERTWAQDELTGSPGTRTISGSHAVIVGLGTIGAATARRLHALGARVTGVRRRPEAGSVPGVADVRPSEDLPDVLPGADAIIIAAPQTGMTRGLIGREALAAMKPDAVLVNVSRGGIVDEIAVGEALRAGRLGGAALDVFRHEPLGPDDPLWDVPNLLITPHTSGVRSDYWDAATDLFAANLRRFERGEPLLNPVDKGAGY